MGSYNPGCLSAPGRSGYDHSEILKYWIRLETAKAGGDLDSFRKSRFWVLQLQGNFAAEMVAAEAVSGMLRDSDLGSMGT